MSDDEDFNDDYSDNLSDIQLVISVIKFIYF